MQRSTVPTLLVALLLLGLVLVAPTASAASGGWTPARVVAAFNAERRQRACRR